MKPRYFNYFALLVAFALNACSTINVHKVDNTTALPVKGGIYYTLPKTIVAIEATVTKIYKVKGPYSSFATKYLGTSNVINDNFTSYVLGDIQFKPYVVPDADQYYFVEMPKGCKRHNGLVLKLSESGIISSINDINQFKPSLRSDSSTAESPEELTELARQLTYKSNLEESIDTIIDWVNLDTSTLKKKIIKRTLNEKTLEQQAKDAADLIMRIKEEKINLITGYNEVNYSKEALQYMYDQLSKTEKDYLNMFTGITVKKQMKYYFTYVPAYTENTIYLPLFRFSTKEGLVDTSSYYGESVYLRIERSGSTKQTAIFEKAKADPKVKTHGFYYRIPEYAKVSMIYNDKVRNEASMLISQFGAVCELPAEKLRASLYPVTGSLRSIAINKKGKRWFKHH